MNGRERVRAILRRQPVDRLSWTTLVDDTSLRHFPERLRGNGGLDFYRDLGCDVLLLNGWGLAFPFCSPRLIWGPGTRHEPFGDGSRWGYTLAGHGGDLRAEYDGAHPVRYPVRTLGDVRAYTRMWEEARFEAADDRDAFRRVDAAVGDAGVVARFWGPSTIPKLLEEIMGTEAFYYLLADHPGDMSALIDTMHEREMEAFRCLADGPCDPVILCENTSTYYISPDIYRRFNGPHVKDFVDVVKNRGKPAIVHMCGHVRNILPDIRRTGLDGAHFLTPPPTGDTPWEHALDVLGEDTIIIGIMDASTFLVEPIDRIGPALDRLYTPRLRRANFILALGADGLPVPLDRFHAVRDWMDRNGAL